MALAVVAGGIVVAVVVWMQRGVRAPEAERVAAAGPAGILAAPVTVPATPGAPVAPRTGEAPAASAATSATAEPPAAAATPSDEAIARPRLRPNLRPGPMLRPQTAAMPGVQFPARLPGGKLPPRGGWPAGATPNR